MISEPSPPEDSPGHSTNPDTAACTNTGPESKSQRKRNAHQITQLARQLVEMKPKGLSKLPIEPDIRDAIRHCAEIRSHGAKKRQLHFVSKLLRESDNLETLKSRLLNPEIAGTRPDQSGPVQTTPQSNPHLEFRNQLLEDFAGMVETLRENYPDIELQQVRQLVRNAQTEYLKAQKKTQTESEPNAEASPKGDKPEEDKPEEASANKTGPHTTKAAKSLLKLLQNGG